MLTDLDVLLKAAIISYLWLISPLSGLAYYYAGKITIKGAKIKPLMFIADKLSCSHCVPFWLTVGLNWGDDNLLIIVFINILVVKLTIKYTG